MHSFSAYYSYIRCAMYIIDRHWWWRLIGLYLLIDKINPNRKDVFDYEESWQYSRKFSLLPMPFLYVLAAKNVFLIRFLLLLSLHIGVLLCFSVSSSVLQFSFYTALISASFTYVCAFAFTWFSTFFVFFAALTSELMPIEATESLETAVATRKISSMFIIESSFIADVTRYVLRWLSFHWALLKNISNYLSHHVRWFANQRFSHHWP